MKTFNVHEQIKAVRKNRRSARSAHGRIPSITFVNINRAALDVFAGHIEHRDGEYLNTSEQLSDK
jgi:hypothetical protein